ncbi:MAG: flagellar motor protein MotB [Candidatus Poribacteria bacterium]|nr:flagellar motor protein MotB [Candidatus Poribacteria bacterium]
MGELEDAQAALAASELEKSAMVEGWMGTYGDLVTLLMCFFVILFAMATLDAQKFKELVISLKGTMGVLKGGERLFSPGDIPKPDPAGSGSPIASNSMAQPVPTKADRAVGEKGETKVAAQQGEKSEPETYQAGEGKPVIVLKNMAAFEEGSDTLDADSKLQLDKVLPLIVQNRGRTIAVVGHADPKSVRGAAGKLANWDIAARRARQVIEYFVTRKGIDQARFELNAYSSVKGPVRESDNPRRVDIIIRPKFRPAKEIKLDEIISQFN